MTYSGKLGFPLPAGMAAQYSTGQNEVFAGLFDGDTMFIPVLPGEYTIVTRTNGPSAPVFGVTGTIVRTPRLYVEATINISNGMIVIGEVINALRAAAIANGTNRLTVHDYCKVDFADRVQGYSVREWWLETDVTPLGFQSRTGSTETRLNESVFSGYALEFKALEPSSPS